MVSRSVLIYLFFKALFYVDFAVLVTQLLRVNNHGVLCGVSGEPSIAGLAQARNSLSCLPFRFSWPIHCANRRVVKQMRPSKMTLIASIRIITAAIS